VARDRQRAKRRKEKRQPSPPSRQDGGNAVPEPDHLHRENVPGSVDHIGEVDQFEAELVAGAQGQDARDLDGDGDVDAADEEELERQALRADAEEAVGQEPAGAAAGAVSSSAAPVPRGSSTVPTEDAKGRGGRRFLNFLRASWAELQRVQWPDRRQVGQATAVVLGFVVVAGLFLGVADYVAEKLVDLII
jgi:preprotein translocase subunit SecE